MNAVVYVHIGFPEKVLSGCKIFKSTVYLTDKMICKPFGFNSSVWKYWQTPFAANHFSQTPTPLPWCLTSWCQWKPLVRPCRRITDSREAVQSYIVYNLAQALGPPRRRKAAALHSPSEGLSRLCCYTREPTAAVAQHPSPFWPFGRYLLAIYHSDFVHHPRAVSVHLIGCSGRLSSTHWVTILFYVNFHSWWKQQCHKEMG